MATELYMPRLFDQQQSAYFNAHPHQFSHHIIQQPPLPRFQQQPYTPQISPLSTSGNASPTSPKTCMTRPIRPLFMPAALRPTEFPPRAPTTRPPPESESAVGEKVLRFNASFMSLGGLSALGKLSRRSTADSGKCLDEDWNLDMFPKPTATPTREHWKVC